MRYLPTGFWPTESIPAVAWVLLCCAGISQAQPSALKTLAQSRGITIGAAVTFPTTNRAAFDSVLVRNFGGIVAENAMKWGSIQPTRGNFTFAGADAIVNFGFNNGMKVRGHNFIWHQQSGFIANLNAPRDTMFKLMRLHIDTVMKRYKGKIDEWDIVNEAVARDSAGMRLGTGTSSSFWSLRTDAVNNNWDFVDSAYAYARRADPAARLIYNDYDCEGMGKKSNLVYNLVAGLKSKGFIDGVGLQCHFHMNQPGNTSNGAWDPQQTVANFQRLAALGLTISLTEIDIRIQLPSDSAKLAAQRTAYETLLSICLAQPACKNFYTWGVHDGNTWITGEYSGYGAPLLFTASPAFTPKPALTGLVAVLQSTAIYGHRSARAGSAWIETPGSIYDLRGRKIAHLPFTPTLLLNKPVQSIKKP